MSYTASRCNAPLCKAALAVLTIKGTVFGDLIYRLPFVFLDRGSRRIGWLLSRIKGTAGVTAVCHPATLLPYICSISVPSQRATRV
jgi:hypothetical protein